MIRVTTKTPVSMEALRDWLAAGATLRRRPALELAAIGDDEVCTFIPWTAAERLRLDGAVVANGRDGPTRLYTAANRLVMAYRLAGRAAA